MKVLIVDDEKLAANRLVKMLREQEEDIEVAEVLDSIDAVVAYLENHAEPDLIFMDVELGDGKSFDILNKVSVRSHIIFITAFEEYAIRAFKYNSVDYLLKPLKREDLAFALRKYKNVSAAATGTVNVQELLGGLWSKEKEYKTRFLVKKATRLFSINVEEVALVFKKGRTNFIKTFDGAEYIVDNNLDELETQLDPAQFFRANRQFITNHRSIDKVYTWFDGKIKLMVNPPSYEEIMISRLRSNDFKRWLGK